MSKMLKQETKTKKQPKQSSLFCNIVDVELDEELKTSYLNYAMSVITDRALPDARDGLKPVQRRVLYAMSELLLRHDASFKKSARIVGETMGKYHPHGDSAIYNTMARMAQDFTMGVTLVDGQGNFGSVDGDAPAAMRYTEARLSEAGEYMLMDIDEDTVQFMPNFDESLSEPVILPSRIPNLLVNGASGIAVGMATNMPPYNLGEISDACCLLIDYPKKNEADIQKLVPSPDFPTGGIIVSSSEEICEIYKIGRGKIIIRAKIITEKRNGREDIIVTEIPYSVNKTALIESVIKFAKSDGDEITDIRDESDRNGMRIVIESSKGTDIKALTEKLFKKTQLESSFNVINLALVDGKAKEFSLKNLLNIFIEHRREVVRRRTEYRLRKALSRKHIVEGLLKAQDNIDKIIKIIRGAKSSKEAAEQMEAKFNFSQVQAEAILEMKLHRLTGMEKTKLERELKELEDDIITYNKILESDKALDKVIKKELIEIKEKFSVKRRTKINK